MELCNMSTYNKDTKKFEECNKPAIWRHPRYPDGLFCDECKGHVAAFFPNDWSKILED